MLLTKTIKVYGNVEEFDTECKKFQLSHDVKYSQSHIFALNDGIVYSMVMFYEPRVIKSLNKSPGVVVSHKITSIKQSEGRANREHPVTGKTTTKEASALLFAGVKKQTLQEEAGDRVIIPNVEMEVEK